MKDIQNIKIRKQDKLQCLWNSSQINGDNLKNVRTETSKYFRKKRELLKVQSVTLTQQYGREYWGYLYRNLYELETCYHLNSSKYYLCQLLNVLWVNDIRRTEIHTAEPLVHDLNAFQAEMAIEKLKDINYDILIRFQQNWFK